MNIERGKMADNHLVKKQFITVIVDFFFVSGYKYKIIYFQ